MNKLLMTVILFTASLITAHGGEFTIIPPEITVKKALISPRIDATREDPAWRHAAEISNLVNVLNPDAEQPEAQLTKIRLLWDAKYLYVRFYCTDNEVFCNENGRDAMYYKGDVSEIFIDPVGDGMTYFEIQVSPYNGLLDIMTVMSAKPEYDSTGRLTKQSAETNMNKFIDYTMPGFRSAAAIQTDADGKVTGWITDFAVPAEIIMKRYWKKELEPVTIRANFVRYDHVKTAGNNDRFFIPQNWSPTQHGCPHLSAAAMGYMKLEN